MKKEILTRILDWKKFAQPPYRLMVSITSNCNLRCKFCDKWRKKKKDKVPEEKFIELIQEAKKIGIKEVHISGGGEPLTRKSLFLSMVKQIKALEMKGLVVTNGTLFSPKDLEMLIKIGWDNVNFSLDAHIPSIHDFLRGVRGAFKRTVSNIETISELKKKFNKKTPRISISTILTNHNYMYLEKMILLCKKLGADQLLFQYLRDIVEEVKHLKPTKRKVLIIHVKRGVKLIDELGIDSNLKDFLEGFLEINKMSDIENKIKEISWKHKRMFPYVSCYNPWYIIMVNEEGKIGPCPVWASRSPISIFEYSLLEAWKSRYFEKMREKISKGNMEGCECGAPRLSENINLRKELEKLNVS